MGDFMHSGFLGTEDLHGGYCGTKWGDRCYMRDFHVGNCGTLWCVVWYNVVQQKNYMVDSVGRHTSHTSPLLASPTQCVLIELDGNH